MFRQPQLIVARSKRTPNGPPPSWAWNLNWVKFVNLVLHVYARLAGTTGLRRELPRRAGGHDRVLPRRQRPHGNAAPNARRRSPGWRLQGHGASRCGDALRGLVRHAAPHGVFSGNPNRIRRLLHAGRDDPGGSWRSPGRRARPVERRGTYLALFGCCFGAGYGLSPVVAGLLLDARLPEIIWTIQLIAAALAATGLLALAMLRK